MHSAFDSAHILYVEDEWPDRCIMERVWKVAELPGRLTLLKDGRDLPAYLDQCGRGEVAVPPSLILLKWQLRAQHGSEVLAGLRRHPLWGQVPVVVLCDEAQTLDIQQAYNGGANAVVVMPKDGREMVEAMHGLFHFWFKLSRLPVRGEEAADAALPRTPVDGW